MLLIYKCFVIINKDMNISTMNPKDFQKYITNEQIYYSYYQTCIGTLTILSTDKGIFLASFDPIEIKSNYKLVQALDHKKLLIVGTDFQLKVWQEALKISGGQISTYNQIAQKINNPKAHRAVGNALGKNKIAYFIPCHRILQKNGNLGGYRWGKEIKKNLLKSEKNEHHK